MAQQITLLEQALDRLLRAHDKLKSDLKKTTQLLELEQQKLSIAQQELKEAVDKNHRLSINNSLSKTEDKEEMKQYIEGLVAEIDQLIKKMNEA